LGALIRLNDILQRVASYHPDPDLDIIKKATSIRRRFIKVRFESQASRTSCTRSRSPGCSPQLKLDEASIVAGLLHDAIEDTLATPDE